MLNSLTGKTVVGIDVCDDEKALRFRCSDGDPVVWLVDGDCCSHSYWHEGLALNSLRGHTVTAVHELTLDDPPDDGYDVIQAYGYAVVTERGVTPLVFRNASNGYYGGYCILSPDAERYRWREITANHWEQGGVGDPPTHTPEELAAKAAEKKAREFHGRVSLGLVECRRQLAAVIPAIPADVLGGQNQALADVAVTLQGFKTTDILVLGVYLTRMAEDTLKRSADTAAEA